MCIQADQLHCLTNIIVLQFQKQLRDFFFEVQRYFKIYMAPTVNVCCTSSIHVIVYLHDFAYLFTLLSEIGDLHWGTREAVTEITLAGCSVVHECAYKDIEHSNECTSCRTNSYVL